MEIKNQPGFRIKSEPEVVIFTGDFNIRFIKMPFESERLIPKSLSEAIFLNTGAKRFTHLETVT